MKRRLLFSAVVLAMAATAMAQTNITPERYNFANLPVGPFVIDGCNVGWGPGNLDAAKASENGWVNITGGGFWNNKETDAFKYFQSGLQILDLTEEGIGKVLCLKGANCSDDVFAKGVKATGSYTAAWPQLAFYSTPSNTPTGSGEPGATVPYIRISVVYKAIENEPDPEKAPLTELEVKAVQPNSVLNTFSKFSSSDMMVKDFETETLYELNEGWQRLEYDFQIGTPEGNPFALSVKMDGGRINNGAILIKEIKFLANSDGTYGKGKAPKLEKGLVITNGGVGIKSEKEAGKAYCYMSGNMLSVANVTVGDRIEVYAVSGALVSTRIADAESVSLPLADKGFYIVRAGNTNLKVANN